MQSTAKAPSAAGAYEPRRTDTDNSGLQLVLKNIRPWGEKASLEEISALWKAIGPEQERLAERVLANPALGPAEQRQTLIFKAVNLNFEGKPAQAYEALKQARAVLEQNPDLARQYLYTTIYLQGLTGLRLGETENCVNCRGASACIVPIEPAAVHRLPKGSRLAVQHFSEYLERFPDDLEVRWLLNLAHMTLGEYPEKVEPRYLVSLDRLAKSEFDIGRFQDIAHLVGLERTNEAGGAIMDDFTNDGLLDLVVTSTDPTQAMAYFENAGNGRFQEKTQAAGLLKQLGGLNCVQTDYNNDGKLDLYIARGAWWPHPIRPSLLRNEGHGKFTDATKAAGVQQPANSNTGVWADFDNDGYLDLFVCCELQPNRLFHNQGDGTFKDVAKSAGLLDTAERFCKGATWIDYDNDHDPDLFVNYLDGGAHLFRNDGKGRFSDVTEAVGIDGPAQGFSCWAFDYDNDGWLDLFATCYDRPVESIVKGIVGQPHQRQRSRLFHNLQGKRFEDVTVAAGLDLVFSTMGSNFGDFDNDGYLDMYLSTGDPNFSTLVPNRMFRNVDGQRFAEITGSSRTGHLQKGHGVGCGDWNRDGNVDLFVELGGTVPGDRYHNVLFQNPGHPNHWLTLKLIGRKTNRAAIGARIKVVTAGKTFHRVVSSGSSFGGNPLQQTIGLGDAERIESVEIRWPSGTTQLFRDVPLDQAYEVTESADKLRALKWTKLPTPTLESATTPVFGAATIR